MAHIPQAVVIVRGPHNASEPNHESELQRQLQSISSNVTHLLIDEDTPSDTEWTLLGAHFHNVEDLQLESGFNEELNDKAIPLHWPLKKLQLNSACGALVQSPFVRQGLVHHLNLYFTCNLRFEGPTNDELYDTNREAISRGKKQQNLGPDRKIEITYLPELVCESMSKVYSDPDRRLDPENEPPTGAINLQSLEIWENDALDTFIRMYGALPHLVDNLHTLRLRSTSGLDFSLTGEETLRQILPALENLKVLNLTVGYVFEDPLYLPTLHKVLPPNITALYFRGPTSLAKSDHWADWLRAFESAEFLPHLQNLAFVLDLHYDDKQARYGRREIEPPLDSLHYARRECQSLYDIASKRGIQLEAMPKEPDFQLLRPVDPRW
ncbi:hypothetical protein N7520_002121 [Penicillium odoratum]|uniref:uncharacterized protein n=1 Tax=Penicillium odoratum TaxID=1167516 RepID=UPI002546B1D0|nr:uncharacterized protein N7520_002121 [Penicillium odoratum]KAJ5771592.1 hypothetical protein N7520_002121 [Penicillium odoratum]